MPSRRFHHLQMGNDIYKLIVSIESPGVFIKMQSPGPYPICTESESWAEASENLFFK